ncbi:hypothetical protein ACFRAE_05335 [Sphingobacterium sp. HJSM2_6]|uniref:hypothetical protein n=1 Tax=Sphingobacterium sp. HJSM2_6 TaxID=3366264 RepID=UPI003BDFEF86
MKNFLFTTIMLCLAINLSKAQDRPNRQNMPSPEERAKRMIENLDKELKLTKIQKDSITKWSTSFSKDQQALFSNDKESREARMEKFKAVREKQTAKIKSILTPEQAKKYEELNKKWGERGPKRDRN